jgi:hypothetical protein
VARRVQVSEGWDASSGLHVPTTALPEAGSAQGRSESSSSELRGLPF